MGKKAEAKAEAKAKGKAGAKKRAAPEPTEGEAGEELPTPSLRTKETMDAKTLRAMIGTLKYQCSEDSGMEKPEADPPP